MTIAIWILVALLVVITVASCALAATIAVRLAVHDLLPWGNLTYKSIVYDDRFIEWREEWLARRRRKREKKEAQATESTKPAEAATTPHNPPPQDADLQEEPPEPQSAPPKGYGSWSNLFILNSGNSNFGNSVQTGTETINTNTTEKQSLFNLIIRIIVLLIVLGGFGYFAYSGYSYIDEDYSYFDKIRSDFAKAEWVSIPTKDLPNNSPLKDKLFFVTLGDDYKINFGFVFTTLVVFMIGLLACCINITFFNRIARFTPVILASIGILGTFVGVFNGLYDFDLSKIAPGQDEETRNTQITNILDGLKTSFITSIWGIVFAVLFRPIAAVLLPSKSTTNRNKTNG